MSKTTTRYPSPTPVLAVNHPVTHYYTIAVGPKRPGRDDRIVAIIGPTKSESVFRWATNDQDVSRLATEVGVSPDAILWDTGAVGGTPATDLREAARLLTLS